MTPGRNHARNQQCVEDANTKEADVADIVGGQFLTECFIAADANTCLSHLKKDKKQCDAWRDEVQNLWIFVSVLIASKASSFND
jgi:hypothetical protein